MKKNFIVLLCLFGAVCFGEGKNLLLNGTFENKKVIAKALDKNLLEHIRNGWDLGAGPMVILPEAWRPCGGSAVFELIDLEEEPEKKAFVHSGNRSAYFKFSKSFFNILNTVQFAPGEYELKFWCMGKGRIAFSDICYGINPATGKVGKHLKSNRFFQEKIDTQGKWQFFSKHCSLGEFPGTVYFILYFTGIHGEVYIDDIEFIKIK
ncbi:MAG: hypothetical protein J6W00_13005 [Lentisphaeria bacterium]|nr:hypothetical protein [Lentisphaeria bacterium]